jgi:multiple antibiotic resistance protein
MSVLSIALAFFLITNPIGNTPAILALVKDYDPARQRKILLRESLLCALLALFFLFMGDSFLSLIQVKSYTVNFCGGVILVLVALGMIFPKQAESEAAASQREPFLVPIATPILAGGGLFTTIMLYAKEEGDLFKVFTAIVISSVAVTLVLLIAPTLQRLLGKRGMIALEQLMGMVLLMLSTELLVKGATIFLQSLK